MVVCANLNCRDMKKRLRIGVFFVKLGFKISDLSTLSGIEYVVMLCIVMGVKTCGRYREIT